MRTLHLLALGAIVASLTGCGDEICNGVDDNDDGTIDEGLCPDDGLACTDDVCDGDGVCSHVPTCSDGLGCTEDICMPDGKCAFIPHHDSCSTSSGACRTGVCGVAPIPEPGQTVVPSPFVSGCFMVLDHGFCEDEWDGCACNGAETCPVTGGDPVSGCTGAARNAWACEAVTGEGDGCTEENCCEPWDPEGCRVHKEAVDNNPSPDEEPMLKRFCDAIEGSLSATIVTPQGPVQCALDDRTYGIQGVDPLLGDPIGCAKPAGYWCEDCNACTENLCMSPTGACTHPALPTPTVVETPPPPAPGCQTILAAMNPCSLLSCDDDDVTSFGCAALSCYSGFCLDGPNANNADPTKSAQCHGYAGANEKGLSSPPWGADGGAQACAELVCANTGSAALPDWDCTAVPHSELCDDGAFCNGPGACSLASICGSPCTATAAANAILASAATLTDTPPAPGGLVFGCTQATTAAFCSDGVACTVDGCDESVDVCVSAASDLTCAGVPLSSWDACAATTSCDPIDGCVAIEPETACGTPDGCSAPLLCTSMDGGRLCASQPGTCPTPVCEQQAYFTIPLVAIEDLCPFHPDGAVPEGDREFAGHGPLVRVDVRLEPVPFIGTPGTFILAVVDFEARESAPDYSTIRWSSSPVEVGWFAGTIEHISSIAEGRALGVSNPGGMAGQACGNCGIVEWQSMSGIITGATVRGDTPDGDISDDANCDEDTWIERIDLAPIQVFARAPCID